MMDYNSLTVAICTLNRTQFALNTLEEVIRQKASVAAKVNVLVIDQTAEETIDSKLRHRIKEMVEGQICEWRFPSKVGLTTARNAALSEIKDEIVVFIDDDVLLPPGYLQSYLDMFKQYPDVYGIAGPVYHRKMAEYPVEALSLADREYGTGEQFTGRNPDVKLIGWKDIMVGCNHAIRRSKAIEVGGYDEGVVGGYHEDTDFTFRLDQAYPGCIAFNPDTWVVHLRAPSGGCRINQNNSHSEAGKLSGFCLLFFRHTTGFCGKLDVLKKILRSGPLRRENLVDLTRQPAAWAGFFSAMWDAFKYRDQVRSPFPRANEGLTK
ncbi:MAG TPA: hypothetical protein DCX14_16045 [Flavobacteriales bacterium]|nr:hypothetical protein [Flavobacteriales bacterium]